MGLVNNNQDDFYDDQPDSKDKAYKKYAGPLLSYTRKLTNHQEDAEDIVGEAYKKFYAISHQFTSYRQIFTYLYRTINGRIKNQAKAKNRFRTKIKQVNKGWVKANVVKIDDRILTANAMKFVNEEINKLPEKCKQVALYYIKDLTTKEIATILETTQNNVREHRKRAAEELSKTLSKEIVSTILGSFEDND